ncbi:hypothetical protein [Chelatococcus asaccharovorans]|uniref:Uncharacterized protein n=1 Tax=Chelatococcus asaccharovorans TaxID=28210 RepID=A0A2V3TW51_9HYPH|nr:hypothetical protein [Chelatococcus asaccharovorans]MBS7704206.1 hypothetical protein [Chelatococcus asaccharovorans]PXW53166.1 hypothetical protein C7450_11442 [Chelatococcus asaccharovorans]CAH1665493.1 conserved hypothetical protein [Chelatococcus asaccharovorans]CAH1681928.1 conserved hypothetical protein [Chelatococcus asaccharovorans]
MLTSEASSTEASPSYDAIARALSETERGRWFLAEYVRRQRHADLQSLIDALGRLQGTAPRPGQTAEDDRDRLRFRLVQMQRLIERTRIEIALAPGSQPTLDREVSGDPLTALARAQEKTTAAIIDAAELIQEMAWNQEPPRTMAGDVTGNVVRDRLAGLYAVAANSMAISERFRLLARLVDQIEQRLAKAVEACDAPARPEPPPRREEAAAPELPQTVRLVVNNAGQPASEPPVTQSAASIREQLQALVARQAAAAPQPQERGKPVRSPGEILAGLTALTASEKLRRFT